MIKKILLSSASLWIIAIFLTFSFAKSFSLLNFINTLFILSLILTVITLILFIIESQFFSSFIKNFKYFFQRINKERQIADEIESKQPNGIIKTIKLPNYFPLLMCGMMNTILSIVISLII